MISISASFISVKYSSILFLKLPEKEEMGNGDQPNLVFDLDIENRVNSIIHMKVKSGEEEKCTVFIICSIYNR